MGKVEGTNNKVPAISAQNEASKLLEQALMQMDGIISGNSGTIKSAHSSPGLRESAISLVQLLKNAENPPPPDPHIAKALLDWLQQFAGPYFKKCFSL
ncbi:unnamed protein product [Phyllotreta striolata]|uniref:Uncharacterized protein n=1 Tax=Phyllotreta striolata TaxID=444603 RepID=A0A9N9XQZ1_PHYSR|nr:unnamed protein product [Phyllotreta striolata]